MAYSEEKKSDKFTTMVNSLPVDFLFIPNFKLTTAIDPLTSNEAFYVAWYLNTDGDHKTIVAALNIPLKNFFGTLQTAMIKIANINETIATLGPSHIRMSPNLKGKLIDELIKEKYFTKKEVPSLP